jgi:transcriptional regulator with XRE-family HTH domain
VRSKPKLEIDYKDPEREVLIRKAVSDLIRTQRKRQSVSLTQEALAYRAGISFEHLNHIENYRATASIEVLDRISRALGFRRLSDFLALDDQQML